MTNPKVVKRKNSTALHLNIERSILELGLELILELKPCVASPDIWSTPLSLFKCVSRDECSWGKDSCDNSEFDSDDGEIHDEDGDDNDDLVQDVVTCIVMTTTQKPAHAA